MAFDVAKYRLDSIAALARQMEFAPHEKRAAQLAAAEELLHTLDAAKAYPFEFVIFRITGYRPKTLGEDLLTGLALQHDLGLLIEQVSDTLDVRTSSLAEPVLTIDDVSERLNVTSKTIQRWRRKGLPARRFVFADGKRRVGFLVGSVERFFATHREQAPAGMNFSTLGQAECDEIIRRARRLATSGGCCEQMIAQRIARKLNRSPATILHTIRKHDAERPADAVGAGVHAFKAIDAERRMQVIRAVRRGMTLSAAALNAGLPRQAAYRAVLDHRIAKINQRKIKFIDDELYHHDDADVAIEAIVEPLDVIAASDRRLEDSRVPRDLPPYLRELYRTPLLAPSRERALFLAFNFYKYRFITARRLLEPQFARARDLALLEAHLGRATQVKNQIVQANLRLVVSVARKHLRPGLSLMELISDGNVTLMRAVESFDVHKGYRFSTYATFALLKGFARSVPEMLAGRHASLSGDEGMVDVPDVQSDGRRERLFDREHVNQLLSRLDDRERRVVLAHFGLAPGADGPATYEQVGETMGLSKQRVRQIEQSAFAKLRSAKLS